MLRLKRKSKRQPREARDEPLRKIDPRTLLEAQSPGAALAAALVAMLVLSWFWLFFTELTARVFPWFSILQGIFIGLAVRRFGHGIDWRFPAVAALVAWAGSFFGNLVVAIPATTAELDASAFEVVRGLTWWSFTTFFDEVITVVDHIYALCAAAVAAFFAPRRLDRHEEYALRTRNHEQ